MTKKKQDLDFVRVYIEVGKTVDFEEQEKLERYKQEDIDYARMAEREKWLSKGY